MIDVALATAPENNVVVHAAAGTGKTWLLTSRIVRLLLAGSAPGSILAITFTRKAAGEIYQRVTERLLALAGADEENLNTQLAELGVLADTGVRAQARELYENHLSAIHALRATTFHAFCQEILRRFPLEAEVPPGFELIETTAELEESAWQALDRQATHRPEGALAQALDILLAECGGVHNVRQALSEFLDHRSDWWAYTEQASDPLALAQAQLRQILDISPNADPLAALAADPAVRDHIARYAQLLAGHPTSTNQRYVDHLTQALAVHTLPDRFYSRIGAVFFTSDGKPRQIKPSKTLAEKIGAPQQDELLKRHGEILTALLAAQSRYKRLRTFTVSCAWYTAGWTLLEYYQSLKAEHGVLDFADLEWKTYRLLSRSRHAEWVQYKLDQRIDHLLVDEFQDTNPTQWRLLLPLLEEMAAGDPERRRSVFLVGDEKQSIYRFRRADPRLFHAARDWLKEHARAATFTQHISWRSSPAVLSFVNLIFHTGTDSEEATASPEDFSLRDFHQHETHRRQMWGHAELLPLIRQKKSAVQPDVGQALRNPLEQPRYVEEDARHREEGEMIVAKIREILGKPVDGGARPLDHGDIMILLRDRTHAKAYEEALRHSGIPYIGTGRGTFLKSLEVRDLRHLLEILIQPYNDLALACVLRSPIFSARDEDLVRLAQTATGSWYERLQHGGVTSAANSPLERAQRLLLRWRASASRIPAHDLLDRIYNEGDLIARYVAAAPEHLQSRVEANLNRFLELALEVDSGRYPSLAHFLQRLDALAAQDVELPAEASHQRRRVRVMTIHAAKGLEAPAVFLADAARELGDRDRGVRALIEWSATDALPRHFHLIGNKETIDDLSQALLNVHRQAAQREEANLLYVALTRAQQVLYVSGSESTRGGRGWYGFIEKRLRRMESSGAVSPGMEIHHILNADGKSVFNTCIRLEFGHPSDEPMANIPQPSPREIPFDPALTKPLPTQIDTSLFHPSHAAHGENNLSPATATETETKQRGIVIHRLLEWLASATPRAALEQRLYREFAETLPLTELTACWREACEVIDHGGFREFFDAARYSAAHNEIPMLYRNGERDVYGIVDRLVLRENEIVLIDYKTHAGATRANVQQLAQNYREQLRQYGAGARLLWPQKKLRLVLLFTACRETVEIAEP